MDVYNNDHYTFIVLLCMYIPLYKFFNTRSERIGILLFSLLMIFYFPDKFRWFQTEYIVKQIVLNKIYIQDTRETYSFIGWNDDGLEVNNIHTGYVRYYVSTKEKEIYTLHSNLYPKFMGIVNEGDLLTIKAWRFTIGGGYFTIYSFKL